LHHAMSRTQGVKLTQKNLGRAGTAFRTVDVLLMKIAVLCVESVAERIPGDPLNQNYKRL
jgi:hypothetical protein